LAGSGGGVPDGGTSSPFNPLPTAGPESSSPQSGGEASSSSQGLTLELERLDAVNVRLILHGTVPDTVYSIYNSVNLSSGMWTFEKHVTGAAGQDWTDTLIPLNGRQTFFLRAATADDTDGDGLSDAEEIFVTRTDSANPDTGNTGIPDGYKDPDGDQWTNIDEIRNGTSPNGWDAPPVPFGFTVTQVPANGTAILTWEPAPGPVQSYVIQRTGGQQWTVPATQTGIELSQGAPSDLYYIHAVYGAGSSLLSEGHSLADLSKAIDGAIVRGPQGKLFIVCSHLPSAVTKVRVYCTKFPSYFSQFRFLHFTFGDSLSYEPALPDGHFDIPVTGNPGLFEIPTAEVPPYGNFRFTIQGFGADESFGPPLLLQSWNVHQTADGYASPYIPFLDGSRHLKENLIFQLRAAPNDKGFQCMFGEYFPESFTYAVSGNLITSGFHEFNPTRQQHFLNEFSPFEVNAVFSNFVFNTHELSPTGYLLTGALYWDGLNLGDTGPDYSVDPHTVKYWFDMQSFITSSDRPVPSALVSSASKWILAYEEFPVDQDVLSTLGLTWTLTSGTTVRFSSASSYPNFYGLPFGSFKISIIGASGAYDLHDLSAGGSVDVRGAFDKQLYADVQVPSFYKEDLLLIPSKDPMPGNSNFVPAPAKPVIAAVGKPIGLTAWAKLKLQNGDASKQIYLQQYFDKAYKANPDGTRSTQETGILSEYGEFFPTEPGRTILTTKPDIDTAEVGECTVHVIKLSVDANHDGEMDQSFSGSDHTTQARPFRFWLNNDFDGQALPGTEHLPFATPDSRDEEIKTQRDLEDFARLWISGLPALDPAENTSVTLHWRNNTGPTIRLYKAHEPAAGSMYLTDPATAEQTVLNGSTRNAYATITPGSIYPFSAEFFATYGPKHFIFEGVSSGNGELVLTIQRGGQILATTSIHIDIKDIKEMYDRGVAVNVSPGIPPSTLISEHKIEKFVGGNADQAKHLIIHVHGISNKPWLWRANAETMFKRLYWSGYQGAFASFRWPCGYLYPETANLFEYNRSEFFAFKSANALKSYVNYLKAVPSYAGYSINLFAHSQGNVVVSEAMHQGMAVDNYILTQTAFPAHAYDTAAPPQNRFTEKESDSPTPFPHSNGGYDGYFEQLQGNLVSFYNPFDFALATGFTGPLETNWEKNQEDYKPETYPMGTSGISYFYDVLRGSIRRNQFSGAETVVTDFHETKAMVARTRTKALGAQGRSFAGVPQGPVQTSIDLRTLGFGDLEGDHNGQNTRPIQQVTSYYREVISRFVPIP
jgi:hypothetical protein